jgi:glycosyltransferase involved in cell wall biosynthesis
MRIVQIADSISVGGAEKQLVVFAAMARQRGIDVTTISLIYDTDLSYESDLLELGSQVVHFRSRQLFDLRRLATLTRFLRDGRFDLAHTHLVYGNMVGACAARMAGLPVVSTLHSTGRAKTTRDRFREALETFSLRTFPQRVIAVGYKVEEAQRDRLGAKKLTILQNAVLPGAEISAEKRQTIRQELCGALAGPILITAGRFATPKALHHMVSAFSQIAEQFPQAVLVMIGDGPLFSEIKAQVDGLGLTDRIRLLGARSDVPELLAAADIYVSSSIWEGLPMAVLEAMMSGLPVVATAVGDIPHVLTDATGLIVPPGQPEALAEALSCLLSDAELRQSMGAAARRHAFANFSADLWMDRLLALYNEVRGAQAPLPKPSEV